MNTSDNRMRIGPVGKPLALTAASLLLGACVVPQPYYPQQSQQPQQYSAPAPTYDYAQSGGYDSQGGADDAQVEFRATEAPPPLPDYEQPPCPESGYLWTPGYWAYGPAGYFWVPGTWIQPPQVGLYWTPGYWAWSAGIFIFRAGYWGPHVGFYGGVRYGGGYDGRGYDGGRWVGREFAYNRAVTNVNVTVVHNTYNQTVINNNVAVNRISYAGGPNGNRVEMTPQQRMAARDPHVARTQMQMLQVRDASANRALQLQVNQGRPPIAATPRAGAFDAPNVVRARGATAQPAGKPRTAPEPRYAVPPPPSQSRGRAADPQSSAPAMRSNEAVRAPPYQPRGGEYPRVNTAPSPATQPRPVQSRAAYPPQRPVQAAPPKAAHPQKPVERKKHEPDHNTRSR